VPAPAEIPKREVQVSQVLALARDYLGTRHKIGGQSKAGIDCSGLAQLSYSMVGVELPRSTTDQQYAGTPVKREEIQLGDLLFFTYPGGSRISHVGIVYEINGENDVVFIHASTSRGVRVDNLYSEYWSKLFRRARRVLD
jgi:cell wall-associated NlpC family hydrolase